MVQHMFKKIGLYITLWLTSMTMAHAVTVYPQPNIFRDVNMIALSDIEHNILNAMALQEGMDIDAIELQILGFEKGVRVDLEAASYEMLVKKLDVKRHSNQFGAELLFQTATGEEQKVVLNGRFEEVVEVPVLVARLPSKHVIAEEDIRFERISSNRINNQMVTDVDFLTGKMLKRSAPVGRPIRARDVMEPLVIERNSSVTMVFETPHMTIRTLAVALEDGSKGELIRVRNASSSRIVQAVVEDGSIVRVGNILEGKAL